MIWRRLASLCYDILILIGLVFVCLFVLTLLLGFFNDTVQYSAMQTTIKPIVVWLIVIGLTFWYFGYSWAKAGQTIGMRAWKIQLIHQHPKELTFNQCCLRIIVACCCNALFGLGLIYAILSANKQTLYDQLCQTQLVKVKNK